MAEQEKMATSPSPTTGMERKATWLTGFLMAMGVVILILASAGPLAQQIGPVSIAVWGFSAFLGIFNVLSAGLLNFFFTFNTFIIRKYGKNVLVTYAENTMLHLFAFFNIW